MSDDDWVNHALTDDSLVAEFLSRLGRADKPPPSPALRLDWSVRQRRSRAPATRHSHDDDDDDVKRKRRTKKKKVEPTRASPTTPLSWSGATTSVSGGGGGGGSEETSDPTTAPGGARSKISVKSEAINAKRPRKKKTLAELREEETLLLKERKKLRKEIETLRMHVQNQRATNESLSRLKFGLESKQKLETNNCLNAQQHVSISSHKSKEVETREAGFSLPDLNLPADGDFVDSVVFYGTR